MDEQYYNIWSFEHGRWWAACKSGYVDDHRFAGLYTLGQAIEICKNANINQHDRGAPNEAMVPVREIYGI